MTKFADNSKVRFDYEILDHLTAGLALTGSEVKSIRLGKISLAGAFVAVRGNEAYLLNANIEPYQPKNILVECDPMRPRKLLVSKKELETLVNAEDSKGLTIVPISVYNKGRYIKIDIGIGRGKKKFDKRQSIKKRDIERDIKRTLKR
jgi:SsrA-binding protein